MIGRLKLSAVLLLVLVKPASPQRPVDRRDPSPHTATLVTVEDGVQLEV
jgi:hypothetical protein